MTLYTIYSAGPWRYMSVLCNAAVRAGRLRVVVFLVATCVFVGAGVSLSMGLVFGMLS